MFNTVVIIGNLTKDPELRYTSTGTAVMNMTVATNRKFNNVNEVFFGEVVVWNKVAELCNKYLRKGSLIMVRGRLKTETWEGQSGKRSRTVITAEEIKFLPSAPKKRDKDFVDMDEGLEPF